MLRDYNELKQASRTNENAYFKIELVKALLNYKAYLPFITRRFISGIGALRSIGTENARPEAKLKDSYLRELNEITSKMSGIYQGDIFFNVMDDSEPMFMVTDYIHILLKNPFM